MIIDGLEDAIAELAKGPHDTRQWLTHGIVEPDTTDSHSVMFNDPDGNPLPNGILVMVKLVSRGMVVPCRIASHAAGEGEGEYCPFGPGDEVLVGIADGDERSGCYIVGRMSNSADVFPTTVAGQDVTNNSISFKRIITPYIVETASSLQFRQAKTGASWSIDPLGNIIFSDGEGNLLTLSESVLMLQESTGSALLQIDVEKKTIALQSGQTSLLLDDANGGQFMTPGILQLVTSGGGYAAGHGVTLEQVVILIESALIAFGAGLTPPALPPVVLAAMALAIPAAGALPLGTLAPLITIGLQSPPDPSGSIPGIGRPGFLY
jgi:hypothetical protein